jgi:predicted  nucleic acid-binding Zn-ribbon protein
MSYTPQTSATPQPQQRPTKKDDRKLIYGILITALLGTWGYIIWDKSKSKESVSQLQSQVTAVDSSRNAIQQEYNDALARLDSATGNNTELQGALAERKAEIDQLKQEIASITRNKNASAAELARARQLIRTLNGKIDDMYAEIERLKTENQELTASNTQLTTEKTRLTTEKVQLEENLTTTQTQKKELEDKVDVASTLHVSGLNITPIDLRKGGKEKSTTTARRVDVLRVSFQLDENRVAPSGTKELYISITDPKGAPVTTPDLGSGTFDTRESGSKFFTTKVSVPYEQGRRAPVSIDWKQPNGNYQTGDYKIEVYHNGFLIGQGVRSLKKGGLFG